MISVLADLAFVEDMEAQGPSRTGRMAMDGFAAMDDQSVRKNGN